MKNGKSKEEGKKAQKKREEYCAQFKVGDPVMFEGNKCTIVSIDDIDIDFFLEHNENGHVWREEHSLYQCEKIND